MSSTIKRNNFVTPGTKVGKRAGKDKTNLKDSEYNKLRAAVSLRPILRESLLNRVYWYSRMSY